MACLQEAVDSCMQLGVSDNLKRFMDEKFQSEGPIHTCMIYEAIDETMKRFDRHRNPQSMPPIIVNSDPGNLLWFNLVVCYF